jgi:hypothetical protein
LQILIDAGTDYSQAKSRRYRQYSGYPEDDSNGEDGILSKNKALERNL